MRKWFTADFHLGSEKVLRAYDRPFGDAQLMTQHFIDRCNELAPDSSDLIYHVGDLYCYKRDGEFSGLEIPWEQVKPEFKATFLPLSGNHDENNGVRTVAQSMRMVLGGRFNCVLCHFPSYDYRAANVLIPGDINICGHVHTQWKTGDGRYFIDKDRKVLNVNVGVDVWGYEPVSETTLVNYITHVMAELQRKRLSGLVSPGI